MYDTQDFLARCRSLSVQTTKNIWNWKHFKDYKKYDYSTFLDLKLISLRRVTVIFSKHKYKILSKINAF